ncbi:hypothetical protein GYMLUDRAFT_240783 [Collybiopsis luxurians FD-317 M1]|nr:hypothetical protein GYMLUDRAFT_240783 [Collybiopsis luxurians FD-317 M1]
MASISYRLLRHGVVNLPKPSPASKPLAENLLRKDAQKYHALFRAGFHNHLSHHILAAYDLGASPSLLQKIFDNEAKIQRSIISEEKENEIRITDQSWTRFLGNQHAYGGFVKFFDERIERFGVVKTLEQFVFSPDANEKGKTMLARLMSGIVHPFILVGYGLEFGNDALVSTGLASAAIHEATAVELFEPDQGSSDLSVLEIFSLVYKSPSLKPLLPYDPNALFSTRIESALADGRLEAMRDVCSKFHVDGTLGDAEMLKKVEQLTWTSVLLMFATGKEGRKPRLDFFLMHLVTSSIFLRSYIRVLENSTHKATIVKAFLPAMLLYTIARGRPVIDPKLIMSATDKSRPPYVSGPPYNAKGTGLGSPLNDEDYNPWSALIEASLYASDSHVLKTMRTLVLAAREFGDTPAGSVVGAFTKGYASTETIPGASKLDGSIFVRAAGMLMDYMGWTTCGQVERDDWDRSGLGWNDAWKKD